MTALMTSGEIAKQFIGPTESDRRKALHWIDDEFFPEPVKGTYYGRLWDISAIIEWFEMNCVIDGPTGKPRLKRIEKRRRQRTSS